MLSANYSFLQLDIVSMRLILWDRSATGILSNAPSRKSRHQLLSMYMEPQEPSPYTTQNRNRNASPDRFLLPRPTAEHAKTLKEGRYTQKTATRHENMSWSTLSSLRKREVAVELPLVGVEAED